MYRFFEQLSSRIAAPFVGETRRNNKVWHCLCGQSVFFPNTQCLACSAALGYLPEQGRVAPLEPGPDQETWRLSDEPGAGLTEQEAGVLRRVIGSVHAFCGAQALLIDHDVDLIAATCTETLVLDFGRRLALGPTRAVLDDPAVRRAYLGTE